MFHILFFKDGSSTSSNLKNILADEGIESEIEIIENELDALRRLNVCKYDLLVLGTSSPRLNSLKLLQKIKLYHPAQPVLVLSINNTRSFALQAMRLNAQGYLTNDSIVHELADAVKSIALGRSYMTTSLTA